MNHPQGWNQQQPPPSPQWSVPQAGYFPTPPPKKDRTKLIVILAIVIPLLAGLGYLGILFVDYSEPVGNPASGRTTNAECKPSDETLRRAGTMNVTYSEEPQSEFVRSSICTFHTLEGSNGKNFRYLNIQTMTRLKADGGGNSPEESARIDYRNFRTGYKQEKVKEVKGIGDEATYLLGDTGASTELVLAVRKGKTVLKIEYFGYTKGFFSNDPMPVPEGESLTKQVAEELLDKIT